MKSMDIFFASNKINNKKKIGPRIQKPKFMQIALTVTVKLFPSTSALMTLPSADKLKLIFDPSFNRTPVAPINQSLVDYQLTLEVYLAILSQQVLQELK